MNLLTDTHIVKLWPNISFCIPWPYTLLIQTHHHYNRSLQQKVWEYRRVLIETGYHFHRLLQSTFYMSIFNKCYLVQTWRYQTQWYDPIAAVVESTGTERWFLKKYHQLILVCLTITRIHFPNHVTVVSMRPK